MTTTAAPTAQQAHGTPVAAAPTRAGVLQRTCACGGESGPTGECADCRRKRKLGLQPALRVGRSNDRWEREADRVADHVLGAHAADAADWTAPPITPVVQRAGEGQGLTEAPDAVHGALDAPGRPLDASARAYMEPRFGHDFGRVRVHDGAAAESATRAVAARAFTVGNRIVFGAGQYVPGSDAGRRLLAHELAHVVQQRAAPGRRLQRAIRANCVRHMAENRGAAVCNSPPSPSKVGSRVGAEIERRFRAASPSHLTQLPIPFAPKSSVLGTANMDPGSLIAVGKVDLAKVVERGANTVRIQIGEVKPMNAQVVAGLAEIKFYADKIEEASDICVDYKTKFLDPLEERLSRLPPAKAKTKRAEAMKEARRMLGAVPFCSKLDAVGKRVTLSRQRGLTWRSETFTMNLGTGPRRISVMTCEDGVVAYRCVEKKKRKKKKKKQQKRRRPQSKKAADRAAKQAKRQAERQARRAARMAEKQAARGLGKTAMTRVAKKAIVKTVGKVAARLALRAVPVLGWILTAIDIVDILTSLGSISFSGGGGDAGGSEGSEGGQGQEGTEGGTQAEGGTQGGEGGEGEQAPATGDAGGVEAGDGGGEGTRPQQAPGGTQAAPDDELAKLGIFDSVEAAEAHAASLPLSKDLLDKLRNSTPEQQQLLNRVMGESTETALPVTEDFFSRMLDVTNDMTAEELATLDEHFVAVQSTDTIDTVITRTKEALEAIRSGKPLVPADPAAPVPEPGAEPSKDVLPQPDGPLKDGPPADPQKQPTDTPQTPPRTPPQTPTEEPQRPADVPLQRPHSGGKSDAPDAPPMTQEELDALVKRLAERARSFDWTRSPNGAVVYGPEAEGVYGTSFSAELYLAGPGGNGQEVRATANVTGRRVKQGGKVVFIVEASGPVVATSGEWIPGSDIVGSSSDISP